MKYDLSEQDGIVAKAVDLATSEEATEHTKTLAAGLEALFEIVEAHKQELDRWRRDSRHR